MTLRYDSLELSAMASFADRFAEISDAKHRAEGIGYPEFHPKAGVFSTDGARGKIVRPNSPYFNYLMLAAFPEEREFEVAMHFTQPALPLFDLLRLVGSKGDFFLYDGDAEKNKKYGKKIGHFEMHGMQRACNEFEDVDDIVKFVRVYEQAHSQEIRAIPLPRNAMGFFRVRTSGINEAQLYARTLCDLARRRYP